MYDIIIIGGGAAGTNAAIVAARNKFKTLLIDRGAEQSYLASLASVNDMPGFEAFPSGAQVLERMRKHAEILGAEIKSASVASCSFVDSVKRVTTNEPATYEGRVVILATGNQPQQESSNYAGEKELRGKGVSHDAIADAPYARNAQVALLGKNAAAAESALHLVRYAEKVSWIIPASKLDIPLELISEVEKNKKIELLYSSSLKQINGQNEVSSVTVLSAGQDKTLHVRYVFLPHQQHRPITDYLNGTNIQKGERGEIMVSHTLETGIQGVFAAGNILCDRPQLNIVSAAQGAIAANFSEKYLR